LLTPVILPFHPLDKGHREIQWKSMFLSSWYSLIHPFTIILMRKVCIRSQIMIWMLKISIYKSVQLKEISHWAVLQRRQVQSSYRNSKKGALTFTGKVGCRTPLRRKDFWVEQIFQVRQEYEQLIQRVNLEKDDGFHWDWREGSHMKMLKNTLPILFSFPN
jgi:hypothetical protein